MIEEKNSEIIVEFIKIYVLYLFGTYESKKNVDSYLFL